MANLLPIQFFITSTGLPLAGGTLTAYFPFTTTPKTIYTDSTGTIPMSNPTPAFDVYGRVAGGIWGSGLYTIVVKDINGNIIWTLNNIGNAADTGSGGITPGSASEFNPAINYLPDSEFVFCPTLQADGMTVATAAANNTVVAPQWNVLTQTGAVLVSKLGVNSTPSVGDASFSSCLRITQSQATAQGIGLSGWLRSVNVQTINSQTVQGAISVRTSAATTMYIAIIQQTATLPDQPTTNVVNSWTNPSFVPGSFFTTTSDPTDGLGNTSVAAITTQAGIWQALPTNITIQAAAANVLLFIWAVPQSAGATIDFSGAALYPATASESYLAGSYASILAEATTANPVISKESLLYNSDFKLFQRKGAGAVSYASGVYCADRWKVYTQTAAVTANQNPNTDAGVRASNEITFTQPQTASQRYGIVQFLPYAESAPLAGRQLYLNIVANSSTTNNVGIALLEWTGTADAPTTNIVNNWTSTNYTAGNFFASSGLTVIGTRIVNCVAGSYNNLSIKGLSLDTSVTNVAVFVWMADAQVTGGNLTFTAALLCEDDRPELTKVYVPKSVHKELADCQYFFETNYNLNVAPGTTVAFGGSFIWGAVGGLPLWNVVWKQSKLSATGTLSQYDPGNGNMNSSATNYFFGGSNAFSGGFIESAIGQEGALWGYTSNANFGSDNFYASMFTYDCDF